MKRLAQFAALLGMALLALQPALAALPCAVGAPAPCAPGCPMTMSDMGADCPMPASMVAGACPGSCCTMRATQPVGQLALLPRPTGASHATPVSRELTPQEATADPGIARSADPFVSPPLYLLHRVFRI